MENRKERIYSIIVYLYSKSKSQRNPGLINNELDSLCLSHFQSFVKGCFPFTNAKYIDYSADYFSAKIESDLGKFDFCISNQPGEFKEEDYFRLIYKNSVDTDWLVSCINVEGVSFSNYDDALEYFEYLCKHDMKIPHLDYIDTNFRSFEENDSEMYHSCTLSSNDSDPNR